MTLLELPLAAALVVMSPYGGTAQHKATPAAEPALVVVAARDKASALKHAEARKGGAEATLVNVNQGEKQ